LARFSTVAHPTGDLPMTEATTPPPWLKILAWWPFVTKVHHEAVRRENWELRGALRGANEELAKYRRLISGLQTGQPEIVRAFEKAIKP
jgi:hypothetical protein